MEHTVILFIALLLASLAALHAAEPKVNVLLILSDDQSYPHVGCYGNKDIMTPNWGSRVCSDRQSNRALALSTST